MPTPAALAAFANKRGTADAIVRNEAEERRFRQFENVGGVDLSQANAVLS